MKRLLLLPILTLTLSGCCAFDRYDDDRDDLPPRPRDREPLRDRLRDRDRDDDRDRDRDRDRRDEVDDRPRIGNLEWIGPSREAPPIYPSVQNLTPREPIPPRAEDPSWRNR